MTFSKLTCTGLLLATPSQPSRTLLSHAFGSKDPGSSRSVSVCSRGFSSLTLCRPTHQLRAPRGSCSLNPHSNAVRGSSERVCSAAQPSGRSLSYPPRSISTALNFNGGQLNINNWYQWGPLYYCWQQYSISRPERCNNRSGPTSHVHTHRQ